jgi:hypothetical protein
MRLGEMLRVESARTDDENINILEIDWQQFEDLDTMIEDIPIKPRSGPKKTSETWSGTNIVISKLRENWSRENVLELAEQNFARLVDPFIDPKKRRRIAIFWNSERVLIPWMNKALTENAHASVNGKYVVENGKPELHCHLQAAKLGFEHPKKTEIVILKLEELQGAIIGRDQTINDDDLVGVGPFSFEIYWYNRKLLSQIDGIGELRAVRELQAKWSGIQLFRDGLKVFPYGEEEDDWLGLDRKALGRSGYALNKTQFVGKVEISRISNPQLLDQTNREGLRVSHEQQAFLEIMKHVIQFQLLQFMKSVENDFKSKKVDFTETKSEIERLQQRTKLALRSLKKIIPSEGNDIVESLQQAIFEFSDMAARAQTRILEVEQESRQMVEMAGVGLMVEVVAHELARTSENALKVLDGLGGKIVPEEVRGYLEILRAEMKSLGKRIRILDPMSISGRQRVEIFSLDSLIRDTLHAHQAQFKRHNIVAVEELPSKPVTIRAVKGMVVQIL